MPGRDALDVHDDRWLARVRAALPAADLDVVAEIAADIAERWRHACASGLGVDAADRKAEADLAACAGSRHEAAACAGGWTQDAGPLIRSDADRRLATEYAAYYVNFLRSNDGARPDCQAK